MAESPAKKATKKPAAKAKAEEVEPTPDETAGNATPVAEGEVPAEPVKWQRYGNSKRPVGTEPDQYGNIGVAPPFSFPRRRPVASEPKE